MKKVFISLFSVCLLFLFFHTNVPIVDAHILQKDGSIGAVLHIDPEDDPIVGQPAYFIFELKDTENVLTTSNCNCRVTILENGKDVYNYTLFQSGGSELTDAGMNYTFPEKNIYQVIVTGSPQNGAAFTPFQLTYEIRVARESTISTTQTTNSSSFFSTHWIHFLIGVVVLVLSVVALFQKKQKASGGKLQ